MRPDITERLFVLGSLYGEISWASSINELGQIVGASDNSKGQRHATLFDPTGNGNNIDLNSLIESESGWMLSVASDINNNGWGVGYGYIEGDNDYHAFLLTPVPEPATLCLLGLGSLMFRGKRR